MKKPTSREQTIRAKIKKCMSSDDRLLKTDFLGLLNVQTGKVRDSYDLGEMVLLITTDRQSAFDRVLAAIPFKGQVLNQISAFWFRETRDIVPNHMSEIPDPNALLAKKCTVLQIEMVIRAYNTGSTETSVWTLYNKGGREICGNILPEGMIKNQPFAKPIITPTTKSKEHDGNITPAEAINLGLVTQEQWDYLERVSLALFDRGAKIADKHGLILVDTKYEFGIDAAGKILLVDEVHTPDSSRYWLKKSYKARMAAKQEPENIDKEFLRLWFKEHCKPYEDAVLPEAPPELVEELSFRYIKLYEMITGKEFVFPVGRIQKRMRKNLANIIN
jgi:phosphoribosylaminoimidazole-succinocarboxamide synthase